MKFSLYSLFMTILMWSGLLFQYVFMLNEAKFKKNIVLGVTIPVSYQNDDIIKNVLEKFKKTLLITFIILSLLAIPACFLEMSLFLFYIMIWLMAAIIILYIPYVKGNLRLKKIKAEKGWKGPKAKAADLKLSAIDIKTPSPYWSIVPLIISLIPLFLLDKLAYILSFTTAGSILLIMILHLIIDKRRSDVVSEITDINIALTTIRRRIWSYMFIGCNAFLALYSILFVVSVKVEMSPLLMNILVFAPTILLLVFVMYLELKLRHKQAEYTQKNMGDSVIDEDDYWYFGMFYFNPNDNRFMIPNRVGSNTTVNIAKPAGKVVMITTALIFIMMPFLGGFIWYTDKLPMQVKMTDEAIVCTHIKVNYNIPMEEVNSITVISKPPVIITKIVGSATDKVFKGTFKLEEYGICEIFYSRDAKQFYVVKTDDTTYIIGK
ncbi:MAG: hypothetical protein GX241_05340 [Ruminococcaceae bacterium]|nr:hypothetical protein [Oscillospiraceae bacterium]